MSITWKRREFIGAMLAVPVLAFKAAAQDVWPSKPVTFIVPFGAGGTSDILARVIAEQMQKTFGKPFLVENRTGAGGSTGVAFGARSPNDGHTVVFVTVAQTINPFIYVNMPYDLVRDFDPVGNISHIANLLVAHPDKVSAKTLAEFIVYLKANPDKLTFGSSGVGSSQHLAGEALGAAVGAKLVHVPYRSSSEITSALLGGHVDLAFDNTAVMMPHVLSGAVRALGIGDEKRHKALPDLPTISEQVPAFLSTSWSAMVVPRGTPKYIIEKLTVELKRILETPAMIAKVEELGANTNYKDPDEFAKYITSETSKWGALVKSIGLKPI